MINTPQFKEEFKLLKLFNKNDRREFIIYSLYLCTDGQNDESTDFEYCTSLYFYELWEMAKNQWENFSNLLITFKFDEQLQNYIKKSTET